MPWLAQRDKNHQITLNPYMLTTNFGPLLPRKCHFIPAGFEVSPSCAGVFKMALEGFTNVDKKERNQSNVSSVQILWVEAFVLQMSLLLLFLKISIFKWVESSCG